MIIFFAIVILMGTSNAAECRGEFINPLTDVCWKCLFPLSIDPAKLSSSEIEEKLNIRIYFDQEGKITSQLGITQVPAVVIQENKHLRIREIKLESKKAKNE